MSLNKGGFVLKTGLEPVRPNGHWILSPTCLPIPPLQQLWYISKKFQSERRDLNPRPSPWQGDALPLSYFRSITINLPATSRLTISLLRMQI